MKVIGKRRVVSGLDHPTDPGLVVEWRRADTQRLREAPAVRLIFSIAQRSDDPTDLERVGRYDALVEDY